MNKQKEFFDLMKKQAISMLVLGTVSGIIMVIAFTIKWFIG
ncbi:hypothetical protein [Lactobacillus taiwanensis]|jgi:preprotein translocase subunit Sss1|nr:hypothetical protein [Lactobacillus taiwanensis]MCR1904229.1 hypothetical protein [Lactobacillus taiwanensis]